MRRLCRVRRHTALLSALVVLAAQGAYDERPDIEVDIKPHGSAPSPGTMMREPSIESDTLSENQIHSIYSLVDANADGRASLREFTQFAWDTREQIAVRDSRSLTAELDTNKDGELDVDEFRKDMEKWAGVEDSEADAKRGLELELLKFQAADANKDGRLSKQELPALFYPETHEEVLRVVVYDVLKRRDRDGDDFLTPEEFFADGSEQGQNLGITDQERADFERLDVDGSGKLDIEELALWESGRFHTLAALKAMFDVADADRDGHLTRAEMLAARKTLAGTEAQFHLMEWAAHHQEL